MIVSPADYRRVHFVGIGVSGSDSSRGDQIEALAALGAAVYVGHNADNLDGAGLVVATSAASLDNAEIIEARARGIPVIKRSDLLASILNPLRGIAVAGTHGKTTTSALIAWILTSAGLDPSVLIGGISSNLGSNARLGRSDVVVAEADEYDGSFLKLEPEIAVITNVEADHLDYYETEERMRSAFADFAARTTGSLIVCSDDRFLASLRTDVELVTYGTGTADWRIVDVQEDRDVTSFALTHGNATERFTTRLAGKHNATNATAAIVVASLLGLPTAKIRDAVASFSGTARRFECKGKAGDVLVVDDYAHHPTEIRVNLEAARRRFSRPVRLVFQPHTYSRTKSLMDGFVSAFQGADSVYLMDIYAARETDTLGITGEDLAKAAMRVHPGVRYTKDPESTVAAVALEARPGDLILTMGAGDVDRLGPQILEALG